MPIKFHPPSRDIDENLALSFKLKTLLETYMEYKGYLVIDSGVLMGGSIGAVVESEELYTQLDVDEDSDIISLFYDFNEGSEIDRVLLIDTDGEYIRVSNIEYLDISFISSFLNF